MPDRRQAPSSKRDTSRARGAPAAGAERPEAPQGGKGARGARGARTMPAGAEATRAERARAALPMAPPGTGVGIIRLSWAATALFGATAVTAAAVFRSPFQQVAFLTAMVLFAGGAVVYVVAFLAGAERSRTHELGIGGWFFLAGSAPRWAQRQLLGSFAVQVALSLLTAGVRPFTTLAFGTLAPLFGLACCGWWGARHGAFGRRLDVRGTPVGGTDRSR